MTATFQNVTPALTSRIPVDSTFVVVYDSALDPLTVIPRNIIFEDAANTVIPFTLDISSDGTTVTINPDSDLSNSTVYTITITVSITELASPNDPIAQTDLTFITENLSQIPVEALTTDGNVNDVFFEGQRVADIFNIRDVVATGSKYDFAYTPRFFDPVTNSYSSINPAKLNFENQKFIKGKFRDQFLGGFDTYLNNIEELNVGICRVWIRNLKSIQTTWNR